MWVNVDKNTGELRVANTIDRESDLVHDGIYNITVRAVDPCKLHALYALFIKSFQKTASGQVYPTNHRFLTNEVQHSTVHCWLNLNPMDVC